MTIADLDHWVSLVCSILGVIIAFFSCVILPIIIKYHKAKADGEITDDEKADIAQTLQDGLEQVQQQINKIDKTDKKN